MTPLRLFLEFFRAGLFAVGGGLATLPFLYDMAGRTGWFTAERVADMLAVSESTPGPIGVNMATWVGLTTAGAPGAVAAVIGVTLPGFLMILVIASALRRFHSDRRVRGVMYALRPVALAMIAAAAVSMAKSCFFTGEGVISALPALGLAAGLLVLTNLPRLRKLHPIVFLLLSAAVGIVCF